jgi:hypothetical protein
MHHRRCRRRPGDAVAGAKGPAPEALESARGQRADTQREDVSPYSVWACLDSPSIRRLVIATGRDSLRKKLRAAEFRSYSASGHQGRNKACLNPGSATRWRDCHPKFRASNKRPRTFVVAYKPFSLVPNNQTWKRLRQDMLIPAYPNSTADQDTVVVLGCGLDRLPSITH